MKIDLKRWVMALALVGASLTSEACVYAPENLEWIDPGTPVVFQGYAENGGKTIQIEAKNQQTGAWVLVGTATSSTSGTPWYGDTLYYWTASIQFDQLPNWTCYFGIPGTCSIPAGVATVQLRFKEDGSQLGTMYTFDQGGLSCVLAEAPNTGSWLGAGLSCASADSPILTLRVLT
jgi:hypothetical protein